jgi:hypothetical protein
MTTVDARACRPIILDTSRPGPARPRRPAATSRPTPLARLPRHHPRPQAGQRPPPPLVAVLALAAAAVLTGARSVTAIAEWAADAPRPVRAALGARRAAPDRWVVPTEATIRRTLGRVDPTALAAVIGAWLSDRDHPGQRRHAVAVDGKTLRGANRDGRQIHLLAAMDHATRAVLAQRQVNGAPSEVPEFQPLLAGLDLTGVVVTADALHTHTAEFLVTGKQAHYLFTVKANQPTLLDRCTSLPRHHVPVLDRTRDRAHGRIELHPQGRHRPPLRPPTRRTGPPGHPHHPRAWHPAVADRDRLRDHQPHLRPGQPRPARRPPPRTLDDQERPALGAGCDLRRLCRVGGYAEEALWVVACGGSRVA